MLRILRRHRAAAEFNSTLSRAVLAVVLLLFSASAVMTGACANRSPWHQDARYSAAASPTADSFSHERERGESLEHAGLGRRSDAKAQDKPPTSGDGPGPLRVMAYSAALTMTVGDVEFAVQQALAAAKELGGYLHSREDNRLTVRVPAERFEEAMARFESLGAVSRRRVEAQDVTEEYVDLEARLRAAEGVRDRLMKLLANAAKVEDTLSVEKELARLNGEIDALKAKLEVLKGRVAMSAIALTFERVARTPELGPGIRLPFAWLNDLDLGRLVGHVALSPWRSKMFSGTESW